MAYVELSGPAVQVYETPMAQWANLAQNYIEARVMGDTVGELQQAAIVSTRAAAYLNARGNGLTHEEAVLRQNQAAAAVRKALGFTYHKDDVDF